jgi:hypothetical protein
MRALGLKTFLPDALQAPIIVTFHAPPDPAYDFTEFYRRVRERGFILYPGKLTAVDTFRVGCIGAIGAGACGRRWPPSARCCARWESAGWHMSEIEQLRERGYVVVPGCVRPGPLQTLNDAARTQLAGRAPPVEFEADLKYPGAPPSRDAAGGETVRRLLDAFGRDPAFAAQGAAPEVRDWMQSYFGEHVRMSRVHHNCLMTKHPRYGSLTNWHRDIRYWSFEREDLVSVWFALGAEEIENGGAVVGAGIPPLRVRCGPVR